jgi:hypothetical protein
MSHAHDRWYADFMTSVRDGMPLAAHDTPPHQTPCATHNIVAVIGDSVFGSPAVVAVSDVPPGWSPFVEPSITALAAESGCCQPTCTSERIAEAMGLPAWDPTLYTLPSSASSSHVQSACTHDEPWGATHGLDHLGEL